MCHTVPPQPYLHTVYMWHRLGGRDLRNMVELVLSHNTRTGGRTFQGFVVRGEEGRAEGALGIPPRNLMS